MCFTHVSASAPAVMYTHQLPQYMFSALLRTAVVFWTAGFVLLTLIINAPLLPWVLRITGLSMVRVSVQRYDVCLSRHNLLATLIANPILQSVLAASFCQYCDQWS